MTETTRKALVPGPGGITAPASQVERALQERPRETYKTVSMSIGQLTKAVASVTLHVGKIQRSGHNKFHNYTYPKMDDILVVVNPLMGEHGLMVLQNEVSREILEGNRLAVGYEFTLCHQSNEMAPTVRGTGMCIARDSKGNWDDKAIAKCHTNARKYYLMSLFQIPTGDIVDNEDDDYANQRQERVPVPGPSAAAAKEPPAQTKQAASAKAIDEGIPHKIMLGPGAGADQWAGAYIKAISKATSQEEIKQWDTINDNALQSLSEHYPGVYDQIGAAVQRKLDGLATPKAGLGNGGMPDPKLDSQESMNWVASQLAQLRTYEAAEAFWNTQVAPKEQDFDTLDWEMLMQEWKRTEMRLGEPPETA